MPIPARQNGGRGPPHLPSTHTTIIAADEIASVLRRTDDPTAGWTPRKAPAASRRGPSMTCVHGDLGIGEGTP